MQPLFRQGLPDKKLPSVHLPELLYPTFSLPFTVDHVCRNQPEQLPVHTQPGLEVVAVVEGTGTLYIDGMYYTMLPNDICFVNGIISHGLATSAGFRSIYAHFTDEAVLSIYPRDLGLSILRLFYVPLTNGTPVLINRSASTASLIEARENFHRDRLGAMNTWGNIIKVLADIMNVLLLLQTQSTETAAVNQQKIFNAVEYMHHHYRNDKLSIDDIAKSCLMSPSYFFNTFSKIMHYSPKEYLNKIRINYSLEQLITTSKKIEAIAYDCGFSYLSSFYHHFKKITGQSPQNFRKSRKLE